MFWNAKYGRAETGDTHMDYISFGKGDETLVLLPGLSTRGIKGVALPLAYMYRIFAKRYKVYVFDRKDKIPVAYSVYDMADDTAYVMRKLGIEKADLFGVSQGGMIAQALAVRYPEMVNKLALGATLSKQNETVDAVVRRWIFYAKQGDYQKINKDTFTLMYSDRYLRRYRLLLPVLIKCTKPDDLKKFEILAKACITFDIYDDLDKIKCPVFVLGGKQDKIVTGRASEEIAGKLGCEIYMYENLGHAAYDEAKDFNRRVYDFLITKSAGDLE